MKASKLQISEATVVDFLSRKKGSGKSPYSRRVRAAETFARIPHDRAFDLYHHKISGTAWLILIELDRLILKAGGQNPIRLWSSRLRASGVAWGKRLRALRQLEVAGVIRIEHRGRGLSPWVTHLWHPLRRE